MDGRTATSNLFNVTSFEKAYFASRFELCLTTQFWPASEHQKNRPLTTLIMRRSPLKQCNVMGSRLRRLLRPSDWRLPPSLLRHVWELCRLQDENTHRKQLVIGLALICHILLVKKSEDSSSCRCQPVPPKRKFAKRKRSQPIQSELISLDRFQRDEAPNGTLRAFC